MLSWLKSTVTGSFLQCPECSLGMRSIIPAQGSLMALFHCTAKTHSTECASVPVLECFVTVLCCDTDCPAQRLDQRPSSPFVLGLLFLLWFALGVIRASKFVGSGSFLWALPRKCPVEVTLCLCCAGAGAGWGVAGWRWPAASWRGAEGPSPEVSSEAVCG